MTTQRRLPPGTHGGFLPFLYVVVVTSIHIPYLHHTGVRLMADLHALFRTHAPMIDAATRAVFSRAFHAQWPEAPSGKIYGETAQADGEAAFRAHVGSPFAETGQVADRWVGAEASPYGFELGITYPYAEPAAIVARAAAARTAWMRLHPDERAGVLAEALVRMSSRFFEIAFATMHTTGQGFMMAFQASGPHAFDRALEAVALGHVEQTRFASSARWEKPMGKMTVVLDKTWRCIGHGVSVAIGCSTFPVWNSFPGMFASLVTGNPVIVKPHPGAILPLAIAVASLRATCADLGVDPDIVQLAVDGDRLIADELVSAPAVRLVDYTGGSSYGAHLEGMPGKIVFTEKAGINSIILDSANALDAALENIAFSLSLYSGQMCTKPQNIYVSRDGGDGWRCARTVCRSRAAAGRTHRGARDEREDGTRHTRGDSECCHACARDGCCRRRRDCARVAVGRTCGIRGRTLGIARSDRSGGRSFGPV
jgi:phenylacetic acid degradation protein paaN